MKKRCVPLAALFAAWLLCIFVGSFLFNAYSRKAGEDGKAPALWPAGSHISRDEGRPTLLLFAHPRCTCSNASLDELERILAQCPDRPNTQVVFYTPPGAGDQWLHSSLWNRAAAMPGVVIFQDTAGAEAKGFHAETAGRALLYDAGGRLLFEGGITQARGMSGDNAGESAILALLTTGRSVIHQTPSYGCPLLTKRP